MFGYRTAHFKRPGLSDSGSDPTSEDLSQTAVNPMHTIHLLQIDMSIETKVLQSVQEPLFGTKVYQKQYFASLT